MVLHGINNLKMKIKGKLKLKMEQYQTFLKQVGKTLCKYDKDKESKIRELTVENSLFWKFLDLSKKDNNGQLPAPFASGGLGFYDDVTILGMILKHSTITKVEPFPNLSPNSHQLFIKLDDESAPFLEEAMVKAKDNRDPFVIVSTHNDTLKFEGVSRVILVIAHEMMMFQTY
jgi:hypothetical protein